MPKPPTLSTPISIYYLVPKAGHLYMLSPLSTPIKVSLPLVEVFKVRPKMWLEILKCIKRMGVELPPCKYMSKIVVANSMKGVKCEVVPLNKVGNYYEGEMTTPLYFWSSMSSGVWPFWIVE